MLFIIGLGLGDADDITLKGLKLIKAAHKIYLESYTAILTVGAEKLVVLCLSICCQLAKSG